MRRLKGWAHELGFSQIAIAGIDLTHAEAGLADWLAAGFHGGMGYMARHGMKRARPAELVPGTASVITARMDYLPRDAVVRANVPHRAADATTAGMGPNDAVDAATAAARSPDAAALPPSADDWIAVERRRLADPQQAVVSVYARGRDYHKVLRARLQQLAERLAAAIGPFGHRVFTDSAPVLEVELAARAGLGWRGKHTLLLSRDAGSMFFLGEIYVDLALPPEAPVDAHCGSCSACIVACPTGAIVAPHRLDARRCISYLTIEHDGPIDPALRPLMGNRIYGCDDCQLACPWNKYARRSTLPDFDVRTPLAQATLLDLWRWDEAEFWRRTEGSAIRRIGYERWRRNLAVALGNAWRETGDAAIADALAAAHDGASALVREHVEWALRQREDRAAQSRLEEAGRTT